MTDKKEKPQQLVDAQERWIVTAAQYIVDGKPTETLDEVRKKYSVLMTSKVINQQFIELPDNKVIVLYHFEGSPAEYYCQQINSYILSVENWEEEPTDEVHIDEKGNTHIFQYEATREEVEREAIFNCSRMIKRAIFDYPPSEEAAEQLRPLVEDLKGESRSFSEFADRCREITRQLYEAAQAAENAKKATHFGEVHSVTLFETDKTSAFYFEKTKAELQAIDGQYLLGEYIQAQGVRTIENAPLYAAIDFTALVEDETIQTNAKRLTPFDRRIYNAVSTLYANGAKVFTSTQLYHQATGRKGSPGQAHTNKIRLSLKKMRQIQIEIDNTIPANPNYKISEHDASEGKYKEIKYEGALLPTDSLTVGNTTYIQVLRKPPLLENAEGKGQIIRVPLKALQTGSDNTIAINDYINKAIFSHSRAKTKGGKIPIELTALKAICPGLAQKTKRIQEITNDILNKLKANGIITDFEADKTGYFITK